MKLLLVRHGETDWNKERRVQGRTDIPLNDSGRAQAASLARALGSARIDAVYASPFSRAYDTARILLGERRLEIIKDEGLAEIRFGLWEGKTMGELMEQFPDLWRDWGWLNREDDCKRMGAESYTDIQRRSMNVVERIKKECGENDNVLLVSHTMPVKLIIANYLQMPLEAISRLKIENCSLNVVSINKDGTGRLDILNYKNSEGVILI